MTQQITAIQEAQQIIKKAEFEAIRATGSAFNNPVWDKLNHASQYLGKQVGELLAA